MSPQDVGGVLQGLEGTHHLGEGPLVIELLFLMHAELLFLMQDGHEGDDILCSTLLLHNHDMGGDRLYAAQEISSNDHILRRATFQMSLTVFHRPRASFTTS